MSQSAAQPAPSRIRTFLYIALLVFLTSMLCNTRPSKNPSFQLQQCGQNLHVIGVELERERLSQGLDTYPETLPDRWGETALPACPVGGEESYKAGYQRSEDARSYQLVCSGPNHEKAEVPPDYPRIGFSSDESQRGSGEAQAPAVEETEAAASTVEDDHEERSTEDIDQATEATPSPDPIGGEEVSQESQQSGLDQPAPTPANP